MDDRGTVTPVLILLLIGGLLMTGLAIDVGRYGATFREAAAAADIGAEAGAAMISVDAAYEGFLTLDREGAVAEATAAARATRRRPDRHVTATATDSEVCVVVRQPFRPGALRAVGIGPTTIEATACARPGQG